MSINWRLKTDFENKSVLITAVEGGLDMFLVIHAVGTDGRPSGYHVFGKGSLTCLPGSFLCGFLGRFFNQVGSALLV